MGDTAPAFPFKFSLNSSSTLQLVLRELKESPWSQDRRQNR
jgi:hypothetical protein